MSNRTSILYIGVILLFLNLGEITLDWIIGDGNGMISHPSFYLLSFGANVLLTLILVAFGPSLLLKNRALTQSIPSLFKEVNSRTLGYVRVLFAAVALIFFAQSYQFIEVVNYHANEEFIQALKIAYPVFMLSIVLIGLGWLGIVPYLINFFLAHYYMHGDVGTHLYSILSFWLILMGPSTGLKLSLFRNKDGRLLRLLNFQFVPTTIALFGLGLTVSMITFAAGVSKALDPIWLNGTGYYYTLMQPWIKVQGFDWMLDSDILLVSLNYLTIVSEIFILPLFIFPRTRLIGVGLILAMYGQLTFPLRIDAIGPFGILIGLFLLTEYSKFNRPLEASNNQSLIGWSISSVISVWLIIVFGISLFREFSSHRLSYPRVEYPFAYSPQVDPMRLSARSSDENPFRIPWQAHAKEGIKPIEKIYAEWYSPFNFYHFFGRVQYRLRVDDKYGNQTIISPLEDDGTINNTSFSGGILKDRVIQNRIWVVGIVYHKLADSKDTSCVSISEKKMIGSLIEFLLGHVSVPKNEIGNVRLDVRELKVPGSMVGDKRLWIDQQWFTLFDYDVDKSKIVSFRMPDPSKFDHIQHELFKTGQIVLAPCP